jgi:hypothetical protein
MITNGKLTNILPPKDIWLWGEIVGEIFDSKRKL